MEHQLEEQLEATPVMRSSHEIGKSFVEVLEGDNSDLWLDPSAGGQVQGVIGFSKSANSTSNESQFLVDHLCYVEIKLKDCVAVPWKC